MPADPCLGKSSFHCDACRCWLKEHLLLRPQPCVQSSFHGKVFCFDAFMEDGHCECSIPLYVFSDISYYCLLADVAEKNFNLSKSQVHIAVIHILQLNVAHKFIV